MTITAPPPRTRPRVQPRTPAPNRTSAPGRTPVPGRTPSPSRTSSPGRTPAEVPSTGGAGRTRSAASQRAYARKAQRQAVHTGSRRPRIARRAPFVLVVMATLAVGLIVSLWLSTAAAGDSYRLEQARQQARELAERSAQLEQEVANLQTAPALAKRAQELGMVPSGEPARLVVLPDGTVALVGKPTVATAPAPPPPATPVPTDPAAGQPAAGQPAAGQPAAGQPAADAQPGVDPATGQPVGQPPADPAEGAAPADPAAGQPPAGQTPPPAGGG